MYHKTITHLFFFFLLGSSLFLGSCDDPQPNTDPTEQIAPPPTSTDPNGTSEYNGEESARSMDEGGITGTYVSKDPNSPEGGGYLVLQQLEDGRIKFELDLNNGPPNYHTGTATGTIELDGNEGIFTTSEYKMSEDQQACVISFLFVEGAVELNQEQGSDMSCGFGQGVVATGIYNKKNSSAIFRYEGGR
jgi:hypothetical protein